MSVEQTLTILRRDSSYQKKSDSLHLLQPDREPRGANGLPALSELDLDSTGVYPEDLVQLLDSDLGAQIRVLACERGHWDESSMAALQRRIKKVVSLSVGLRGPALQKFLGRKCAALRHLRLHAVLTPKDWERLCVSGRLPVLETLELHHSRTFDGRGPSCARRDALGARPPG